MAPQGSSFFNILIADDDEDDCMLLREAFRDTRANVRVSFVHDGEMLLEYLHGCDFEDPESTTPCPDLTLLDLNMPRLNGHEALKRIRADNNLRSIPVVIFSNSNDAADIELAYSEGANSYIRKPSGYKELIDMISGLVSWWFDAVALLPRGSPLSETR